MKIIDKKDRNVLSEGRKQGIGFAMLKKIDKENYETVMPISPCKDYLAEVIYTERTGIPSKACGLVYDKKENILEEKYSYMVIKPLKSKANVFVVNGKDYETFSSDLKNNIKNIENFVNKFQKGWKFLKTIITECDENNYLIKFDSRWTISSYSISLFSLLLRIGENYKQEDIIDYLLGISEINIDRGLINSGFKKIVRIYRDKKLPDFKETHLKQKNFCPHGLGIIAWDEKY